MPNAYAITCANNSCGTHVTNAYQKLGPINKFGDVLIPAAIPCTPSVRLAAEQIVHLTDAWRYAASAIAAFLKNSHGEALHLAYYAELRAAFSLYSGSGIRLDSNDNYYVDKAGMKRQLPTARTKKEMRTHTIVWDLWNEWIKRQDAHDLLLDGLRIAPSISLRSMKPVLTLFSPTLTVGQWGYDLIMSPTTDRNERNKASYQARSAVAPLVKMTPSDLEFVLSLSRLLLPAQSGLANCMAFDTALIRYLAKLSIESKVPDIETDRAEKVQKSRQDFINELSAHTGQEASLIENILEEPDGSEIEIFDLASQNATAPRNVLSRAIFLLRLATLSVEKNTNATASGPAQEWLLNWLDFAGIRERNSPVDPVDLYLDLENAIDLHGATKYSELPAELWGTENAANTYLLSRADRSLAWGVLR
jgi:hypothetical protein